MLVDKNSSTMAHCPPEASHFPASPNMGGSTNTKRTGSRSKRQLSLTLDVISELATMSKKPARMSRLCSVDSALNTFAQLPAPLNQSKESQGASVKSGGFLNFQASHPSLCESKSTCSTSGGNYKCTPLTSMSQPCLSVSNVGPTKILPFLYLGSQKDALSQDILKHYSVGYVLNVSTTCPKPGHIKDSHFHRIPVNDNYSDKLAPHFNEAFQFIDKVREASGCVLVHCLAGISRSPTVAIAYVMKYLNTSSEEAYKYVKDKRPTISPNFNFLGQLMEFEKQLKSKNKSSEISSEGNLVQSAAVKKETPAFSGNVSLGMKRSFSLHLQPSRETPAVVQSPTTALARLNFNTTPSPLEEVPMETPATGPNLNFPQFPTTSLDKLSYLPCFTTEEKSTAQSSVRTRHPSGNNNNNGKCVGGTKRPLSTSSHDNPPSDCTPCSGAQANTASDRAKSSMSQVVCRSPESKAKRPLVRPNSIAFSTYPLYDFGVDHSQGSSKPPSAAERVQSPPRDAGLSAGSSTTDKTKNTDSSHASEQMDTLRYVEGSTIHMHAKELAMAPAGAINNLARKSQSLEDILNSQEEEAADWSSSGCTRGKKGKHSHHTVHAADLFSQPVALDRVQGRCRGSSDPHQSSSSISSSGSHNSLQGSLELIPVS